VALLATLLVTLLADDTAGDTTGDTAGYSVSVCVSVLLQQLRVDLCQRRRQHTLSRRSSLTAAHTLRLRPP
jgi:hypothetical protein